MRWLDAYIDGLHKTLPAAAPTRSFGPFSVVGSFVNIVVCSIVVVAGFAFAVQQPAALSVALVGLAMLAVFIRVHVRARRGDFDIPPR
ncbi:MAG: hypothetical protein QM598_06010 [Protaetiibacter sp.]